MLPIFTVYICTLRLLGVRVNARFIQVNVFKKLQPPGFRNIKTAIAVFLCLLFYSIINREGSIFAIMAILICMQDRVEKTIQEGINRIFGTVIGATFGIVFVYINLEIFNFFWQYVVLTIGLILLIHICNLIKIKKSVVIAGIVYFVIILGAGDDPIWYSIHRTIDTLIGIVLAALINRFMFVPKMGLKKLNIVVTGDSDNRTRLSINNYTTEETYSSIIYEADISDIEGIGNIFTENKGEENNNELQ